MMTRQNKICNNFNSFIIVSFLIIIRSKRLKFECYVHNCTQVISFCTQIKLMKMVIS